MSEKANVAIYKRAALSTLPKAKSVEGITDCAEGVMTRRLLVTCHIESFITWKISVSPKECRSVAEKPLILWSILTLET